MNEFERLLKSQPFRPLPPDWRAEILDKKVEPHANEIPASWRDWFWPSPSVWAAMAAVWVLFVCVQSGLLPDGATSAQTPVLVQGPASEKELSPQTFRLTSADNALLVSLR
jgi:hypothetical protein